MYNTAVVAGKFYPLHLGHVALIEKALSVAHHVDVLLVANKDEEISPYVRALAIYETFSDHPVRVKIVDDPYTDDSEARSSAIWAEYTHAALGSLPDVVVASEDYGRRWAHYMGSDFVMFDKERNEVPISGTMCRANAFHTADQMPPATKRYMVPRIVVLGAESTGTTTLANALAEHYGTVVVPEVGRILEEHNRAAGGGGDASWDDQQFWLTSRAQDALEERLAEQANGVLICDTDSLATAVWYRYYMAKDSGVSGSAHEDLLEAGVRQATKHTLYILTLPDIPFEQDPYNSRTGEHLREWHTEKFRDVLMSDIDVPFIEVGGSRKERLSTAIAEIDKVVDRENTPVLQ